VHQKKVNTRWEGGGQNDQENTAWLEFGCKKVSHPHKLSILDNNKKKREKKPDYRFLEGKEHRQTPKKMSGARKIWTDVHGESKIIVAGDRKREEEPVKGK